MTIISYPDHNRWRQRIVRHPYDIIQRGQHVASSTECEFEVHKLAKYFHIRRTSLHLHPEGKNHLVSCRLNLQQFVTRALLGRSNNFFAPKCVIVYNPPVREAAARTWKKIRAWLSSGRESVVNMHWHRLNFSGQKQVLRRSNHHERWGEY